MSPDALLPLPRWWPLVNRRTLRADLLAGIVGAVIVLPQGVAFATIAGMPPEYGLYAAMVPAVVAALFGSSWHLISGPTTAISIFLFASLTPLAEPGSADYVRLALTLTFLTGVFQLAMGLARLGTLVNFISHTVVIGFTAGAAFLIVASQMKSFFGIHIERGLSFHETLFQLLTRFGEINPHATAVGALTLAVGIVFRKFYPRFPYMIAAMLAGSLAAMGLDAAFGRDVTQLATIGALPSALPPLSMPDLSYETLSGLLPMALAVTILALTEAVSIARAIGVRSGQRIDGNREFIGQGLSNLCGAFFSAYASSGSFNRSGLNYEAGAKTPLAAIIAAVALVGILLLVAPLAAHLPIAVMGAVLFLVAWGLIDFRHIASVLRTSRAESAVMLVTFLMVLFSELDFAVYTGVIMSLLLYLARTSRPQLTDVKPDPAADSYHFADDSGLPDCPQLKMLRINGSLFFGAVNHVQGHLEQIDADHPQQKHLLLVAGGINFTDVAGAEMLAQEARRRRGIGGALYFYRMKDSVRDVLARGGHIADIGAENIFPVKTRPVAHIYPHLDNDICRTCHVRIFRECRSHLPDGTPRSGD
jgi:SulP family sulfate permease